MIRSIEHGGKLIHECTLPGEGRDLTIYPAHPNGIQVSRDRWLIVYATRGFRFTDDDRSIVYQLRQGTPDGPVLKEGMLSRSSDDWEPFGDGSQFTRQHGHPVVFGVPKGAVVGGRSAPSAGVFVVKWRVIAMPNDRRDGAEGQSRWLEGNVQALYRTQAVEWVQLRLDEREDDVEILQPRRQLRQRGYESGEAICERPVQHMNQSFVQAVPLNAEGSEWADVNHFDGGRIAALRYVWNRDSGLYEWTQTGPLLGGSPVGVFEASLTPHKGGWVISARRESGRGPAWMRTDDPFGEVPETVLPGNPASSAPLTAYRYADGVLRVLTGDPSVSPYGNARDPLYCWDVDPDKGFEATNRRVIYDAHSAGLPIRPESFTTVDMSKLLSHMGGRRQYVLHRVRPRSTMQAAKTGVVVNHAEMDCAGIYYAVVTYDEEQQPAWRFGE